MRRSALVTWFAVTAILTLGCAPKVSDLRFSDRPSVTELDDRRPIPPPVEAEFEKLYYFTDVLVRRPLIGGNSTFGYGFETL